MPGKYPGMFDKGTVREGSRNPLRNDRKDPSKLKVWMLVVRNWLRNLFNR